ncbi:oxidoreductase [Cladophialophora psammophila CBS 110553]|uniref:Oxidoreductase n=1 Tax=Cladophialophora psammophila CBS 110553 TaxID=1182543 RepID=W9WV21_9EURO|nr:oxidoreductase [Cladophialophora psammophila CBS 110553]EXJ68870.1 oxidoreductase [Cladophialophora psammophila CBS 110553]
MSITTPVTQLLGIQHPILLAGMGQTSGAPLAAAVSNAGGLGVIGGVGYTPKMLQEMIDELKAGLKDPSLPFGVDLLIPQVGGNARKTNLDYTKGTLNELVDIIIAGGAKLFVSAVGVAPRHVVDKLHKNGVLYMNMIGHPKHVHKACQAGADIICAQGGEAGGHTGDTPTSVLIPACADIVKNYTSPLTGQPVQLVAAGGIYDGRGIAAALMLGASAVWVGTRFVTAKESGAPEVAKRAIIAADFDSTIKSTIWTGRPLRALATPYVRNWETNRRDEILDLQSKGIIALHHEMERLEKIGGITEEIEDQSTLRPMGQVAGLVNTPNQTAAEIVAEMMDGAVKVLSGAGAYLRPSAKL